VWRFTMWYYNQMDTVFVPSRSTAQELIAKGIRSERIKLFPRGVDLRRFHPSKRNPRFLRERFHLGGDVKLLYVGRISKEKNLHLLGEVFRALSQSGNDVQLMIVGDGPYLGELRDSMKGTPCVFTGYLEGEDLAAVYASCDLFIFPSTTDTFGNVVLEAQASGIPVVVTDSGGPCENILPEETGLVVEAHNADSLLYAIRWFIRSRQTMKRMGEAARRYMEERSFESAFNETWGMYETKGLETEWRLDEAI
jgi:glycosyltransferase involved in cell wall biosynthesis